MPNYDFLLEHRLKELNSKLAYRHTCCMSLFEQMLKKFLAVFPTFTDHTLLHTLSVTNISNQLLRDEVKKLNADEIYIYLMASALHDKVYNGVVIKMPPLVMLMLFALLITGKRNQGSLLIAYIGLSLFVAANLTGVFCSGVIAVAQGEIECARTLGFTKERTFFHIMLPQIIQNIVPIYMSMFVMCMQITSVSSVIRVTELLGVTNGIDNAWLGILVSIVCYYLIGTFGDIVITRMGKRKHIKGRLTNET